MDIRVDGTARLESAPVTPTVGRIVHYQSFINPNPTAAIITAVHEDGVNLAVFDYQGETYGVQNTQYAETPTEGCWSWPAR